MFIKLNQLLSQLERGQFRLQAGVCSFIIMTGIGSFGVGSTAQGQPILECQVSAAPGAGLSNIARYEYGTKDETLSWQGQSNLVTTAITTAPFTVTTTSNGVRDAEGNRQVGLGTAVDSLTPLLEEQNFSPEQIKILNTATVEAMAVLTERNSLTGAIGQVKRAMATALADDAAVATIIELDEIPIALVLLGFGRSTLEAMGLRAATAETVSQTAQDLLPPLLNRSSLQEAQQELSATVSNLLREPEQTLFAQGQTLWNDARTSEPSRFVPGETLNYSFILKNNSNTTGKLILPPLAVWQQALSGPATLKQLTYRPVAEDQASPKGGITETASALTLAPQQAVVITATITVAEADFKRTQTIRFGFGAQCGETLAQQTVTILPPLSELRDPFGQLTGCNGEILADYRGFTVGLYEPAGGGAIGTAVPLTRTELPDNPNNSISAGLEPNIENSNPFFLANGDEGKYNFLLDVDRGQLDNGATYILLVNPPEDSLYDERRIRIVIGQRSENRIRFTATSLDGRPISVTDPLKRTIIEGSFVVVEDAERLGLNLAVIDFQASTCQAQEVDLDKFADRAAAEIGDIVIYRLTIRNLSQDPVRALTVTDQLPAGLNFIEASVRSAIEEVPLNLTVTQQQRRLSFDFVSPPQLPSNETLTILYGAEVTPDAMRGSGINTAAVVAQIRDREARDGPVTHELDIRPGILNDCGTLIGRVFVDKNADGEQQPGEPGVPNAVIYLEDGYRISTDADGLYSLKNVCPGFHTGILDLTSIPDYELAPNPQRRDQQSPSRLFKMSPGGMVRLNFGVIPTAGEGANP